jgi:long-chain acyl-CoA synthetase
MTNAAQPPWLAHYPAGVDWRAPIPQRSLLDLFDGAVAAHGERICIRFLGKEYTYAEIGDLVRRAARGLRALGVRKGVNVGLCLPNTPYSVILFYAILRAGGTVANFNPLYAERELADLARLAKTKIVATLDVARVYDKVAAAQRAGAFETVVLCRMTDILPFWKGLLYPLVHRSQRAKVAAAPQTVCFSGSILRAPSDDFAVDPCDPVRDVAVLQFTGGTTGTPKAAMLTHANLTANAHQVRLTAPSLRDGEERILGLLPLCHVFAMTVVMNLALEIGATMILLPRFDLAETLGTIAHEQPSVFPGVPAVYAAINGFARLGRYDLSSVRYCISGGAALPLDVKRQFEANTGCRLFEGYGLSEASPVASSHMDGAEQKEGSIGLPLPATEIEIRAVGEPSRKTPPGEPGEICIRGPQVMLGYLQRPDATARTIVGGWLHTGDIGYQDEDGHTFLVDRIKDVIVRDGYKAYPRVIEDAMREHPDVAEVCVVGIPDAQRGAYPKAFVRLAKGAKLDERGLREFLKPRLSPIEIPKEFEFRSKLPRTIIGKPDKQALVEESLGAKGDGA